jgi:hypothetical protein
MADDYEPRYFSSLIDATAGYPAQRTTPEDNRSLFIEAMADATRRRIAFDVVERNCRMRFRVGEEGIRVFLRVLELVRLSEVDEAVDEFKKRFLPMLDQRLLKRMMEQARGDSETGPQGNVGNDMGSNSPPEGEV